MVLLEQHQQPLHCSRSCNFTMDSPPTWAGSVYQQN